MSPSSGHRVAAVLLGCVVLLGSRIASAERKLYVVMAFDTSDSKLAQHARADSGATSKIFSQNLAPDDWQEIILSPEEFTQREILDAIQQIPADADDAIVFLYCGHGGYNGATNEQIFLTKEETQQIPRRAILGALTRKKTGLVVLMSNACFNYFKPPVSDRSKAFAREYAMMAKRSPLFSTLFFRTNGVIDVTACDRDQKAYGYVDASKGTIFFAAFQNSIAAHKQDASFRWANLIDDVSARVQEAYRTEVGKANTVPTQGGDVRQRTQTVLVNRLEISGAGATPGQTPGLPSTPTPPATNTPSPGSPAPPPNRIPAPPVAHIFKAPRMGIVVEAAEGPGVLVAGVTKGGPATRCTAANGARRSLTPLDVITVINGTTISSPAEFAQVVRNSPDAMSFTVLDGSDGQSFDLTIALQAAPGTTTAGGEPSVPPAKPPVAPPLNAPPPTAPPQILRSRFGAYIADSDRGVQVTGVIGDSPATRCRDDHGNTWRLETGDIISHVNGVAVPTEADYRTAVKNSPRDMELTVVSGGDGNSYQLKASLNY